MRRLMVGIVLLIALQGSGADAMAQAVSDDPAIETRARKLFEEFRCLVCEGQSLAQSEAELAQDMRSVIRQRLKEGASEDEIRSYLRSRYGDYILLKPPLADHTIFLWLGPFIFLIILICAVVLLMGRLRRRQIDNAPLSESEQSRLAERLSSHTAPRQ